MKLEELRATNATLLKKLESADSKLVVKTEMHDELINALSFKDKKLNDILVINKEVEGKLKHQNKE